MNYRIITKIACKLLALHFFLISMNYMPSMILNLIINHNLYINFINDILPTVLSGAIMISTAILLWVFADKLSKAIIKEIPENIESNEIDYQKIAVIAFTVVGLFVLTKAVPELIRIIVMNNLMLSSQLGYKETKPHMDTIARIIGEIVKVGLGLWLLLGAKGIFRGIKALRNLGLDRITKINE